MKNKRSSAKIGSSEAAEDGLTPSQGKAYSFCRIRIRRELFYWAPTAQREHTIHEIIYIALAGALGTVSRFGLTQAAYRIMGTGFPYGTLLVNTLGSMLIGYLMQVGFAGDIIPRSLRLAVTVGFLGAFTTFSTFSYETAGYIQNGQWTSALANIATNMGLSILATIAGLVLGRITIGNAG